MFVDQRYRFKANASFRFMLQNSEAGVYRYYHSSPNQGRVLEVPHLITSQEDFNEFVDSIAEEDVLE